MTIPKSLEGIAGTEKATIFVGPDEVEFRVCKNIICQVSDFFSAAFERGFRETQNGVIGKLPRAEGKACHRLLYDIHILAEKMYQNSATYLFNFLPGSTKTNQKRQASSYTSTHPSSSQLPTRNPQDLQHIKITSSAVKAPTYLGDRLGIELVDIFVGQGPNRQQFVIHKKLICDTADFFRKAFMGSFKENSGTMVLPDEKPEAFVMFVDWLYRSDSEVGRVTTREQSYGLFKLYFFAEKLCTKDLQNRLIGSIRITTACTRSGGGETGSPRITIAFAVFIFNNTLTELKLRAYCVHELSWRLWRCKMGKRDMPDPNDMMAMFSLWSEQEELIKQYFEFIRSHPAGIDFPCDDVDDGVVYEYMFHRHSKGEDGLGALSYHFGQVLAMIPGKPKQAPKDPESDPHKNRFTLCHG
ncbi:hypothetical protein IFR05_006662 [Cadophora sp. M221]|nr:hypothetical protein IFR05_006662 [Cadophora sp. M221]